MTECEYCGQDGCACGEFETGEVIASTCDHENPEECEACS
jgi:hypothetical protein|tara:strand:- start:285 stop:404 length:120 start_codon:yes stop_codon:yes gene_type:complete